MRVSRPLLSSLTYTLGSHGSKSSSSNNINASVAVNVYVPITSRCNARTLPETRGPNFVLPANVVASLCRFRDFEANTQQWTYWCAYLDTQEGYHKLPAPMEKIGICNNNNNNNNVDNDNHNNDGFLLKYNPEIVSTLIQEIQQTYKTIDTLIIAGEGEPTLRLRELLEFVQQFKELGIPTSNNNNNNNTPQNIGAAAAGEEKEEKATTTTTSTSTIRLTTNGLITTTTTIGDDDDTLSSSSSSSSSVTNVVESLYKAGISHVSVALMTADAKQYETDLMQPTITTGSSSKDDEEGKSHDLVCKFIQEAVRVGLIVETTAIDRPDVDKAATEALSRDLQVTLPVRWRPYFG